MERRRAEEGAEARRVVFAGLMRRHEKDLMLLAHRLCRGDADRAQDLVQDALIRAYQAYLADRLDMSQDTRAWLRRILTNLFINDYHKRQRRAGDVDMETLTASGETGPPQTHAAPDDVPGVRLLAETLDEELERAVNSLSDGLRLCVVLVDMEGLEYAEAASLLGVPIGTVRSRLARARMRLHDLLQDFARRRGLVG